MKTLLILLCSLCLAASIYAQAPADQSATPPFTSDELDQLLGPIALYPDPLIGLVLPASTVPSDIVVADRYVEGNGDPDQIANQPWDDSVKGLTHYPDLLKWLDQNLAWTTQVGTAYLAQPADVMTAIQQLRARARADGTLMNTDQQQVGVDDNGNITISPTNPDTVYVPQYDPDAVYNDDYTLDDGPVLSFDDGWPIGPWLSYWPYWHRRGIFYGDWHQWRNYRNGAGFAADPSPRPWTANPNRVRTSFVVSANTARPSIVAPRSLPGVKIIQSKHPVAPRANIVSAPQTDFTGRGVPVQPRAIISRPVVVQAPAQVPQEPVYSGYGRGSDARAASERGFESRQSSGVVVDRGAGGGASYGGERGSGGQSSGGGRFGH